MQDYRVESKISNGGSLVLTGLPFAPGDTVEVVVRSCVRRTAEGESRYPLRGKPIRYTAPFGGVAEEEWDALR